MRLRSEDSRGPVVKTEHGLSERTVLDVKCREVGPA